jgi:hypothetical protein
VEYLQSVAIEFVPMIRRERLRYYDGRFPELNAKAMSARSRYFEEWDMDGSHRRKRNRPEELSEQQFSHEELQEIRQAELLGIF